MLFVVAEQERSLFSHDRRSAMKQTTLASESDEEAANKEE